MTIVNVGKSKYFFSYFCFIPNVYLLGTDKLSDQSCYFKRYAYIEVADQTVHRRIASFSSVLEEAS